MEITFKKSLSITILLLFITLTGVTEAQNHRRFRHLTINEGLAHTDALCFEQDNKGFIWIGTNSGLQKYDGYNLKSYYNRTSRIFQVYNNRILSLLVHEDFLWVGTEGGIHCFNLLKEEFVPLTINDPTGQAFVSKITNLILSKDKLWIIADGQIFNGIFDKSTNSLDVQSIGLQHPAIGQLMPDLAFSSITTDNTGHVWAGSNRGLFVFDLINGSYEHTTQANSAVNNKEIDFQEVSSVDYCNDFLWLLSTDQVLVFLVNKGGPELKDIYKVIDLGNKNPHLNNFRPSFLKNIDNSQLWLGSPSGLLLLNEPLANNPGYDFMEATIEERAGLSSSHISSLHHDRSGCVWIGTWGGGANILDLEQKKFNTITADHVPKSIFNGKNLFVRSIVEDEKGMVWLGTKENGVLIFNPQNEKIDRLYNDLDVNRLLSNLNIRSMASLPNGMAIGTMQGINLIDFNSGKVTKIVHEPGNDDSFPPGAVYSLSFDHHGQLWAGTWGFGLVRIRFDANDYISYKLKRFTIQSNDPLQRLSSNTTPFVLFDADKNELLVSSSKGLNRLILDNKGDVINNIIYRACEEGSSMSSEYLWPTVKENDSTYWAGTLGGGLNRLTLRDQLKDNGTGDYTAISYNQEQGLPGNDVESLLMDEDGHLWLGGMGLSRFNPGDSTFWNFDTNDGLQGNGFKIGSALKSSTGILYFGGINGFNYFEPKEIQKNPVKPEVILSSLSIKSIEIAANKEVFGKILIDKSISYIQELRLRHFENDLTFSLSAGHYANPNKNRFKYMLEGFDENWHFVSGNHPVISFSNLNHGTYLLKINSSNNDGIWSDSPIELPITISPPWWKSKAAYMGYVLIYIFIVWSVIFYFIRWMRMKQNLNLVRIEQSKQEELHQHKLQFFTNISHEFKTPLSLILTPVEKLLEEEIDKKEQHRLLSIVASNANKLLTLITELIEFRRVEYGNTKLQLQESDLSEFVNNQFELFKEPALEKNIQLSFNQSGPYLVHFDIDKMGKIITNVFSNALKFCHKGGRISVSIEKCRLEKIRPYYQHSYFEKPDNLSQDYVFIRTLDTGVGITPESLPKVFERFFQEEKDASKHLGSGIGLALLRSLVLLHQGIVIISSERDKGTEIIIGLPALSGETYNMAIRNIEAEMSQEEGEDVDLDSIQSLSEDPFTDPNEDTEGQKATLLIAEDNKDLREMLHGAFAHDYTVIEAEDGVQALEAIGQKLPDLIITDLMMPNLNGLQLIKKLRDDINTSHLPIVILTAKTSLENHVEGFESGADLYIPKPFSLKLLKIQVLKLIESRKTLREKYAADIFADTRDIARNSKDRCFLDNFISLVDRNIDNSDFSVDKLSLEVGIGRTNLYKKIKSLTGQTMGDFIRDIRLKKAANILLSEDVSISEVIHRVGLNSNSYFSKAFKNKFGITPSEFIQNNSKKE